MSSRPIVYIAGPMRGIDCFNFPVFFECEEYLARLGCDVRNPARHDREAGFDETQNSLEGFDLNAAMLWDLEQIAQVDTIVLLPGWSKSSGVALELHMARFLDKMIAYYDPDTFGNRLSGAPLPGDDLIHGLRDAPRAGDRGGNLPTEPAKPASGEVRVTNPTTGGQKGTKPARMDLIPGLPLWQLGEVYGKGAAKYAAYNWMKGYDWSLSFASLQRHAWLFWMGQDCDEETGLPHMAHAAWHCFTILQFMADHPELDDRPGRLLAEGRA